MRTSFHALLATWLAAPFAAAAADTAPIFNPAAARAVLAKPDIRRGSDVLRNTAILRTSLIRRAGFEDGSVCTAPIPISGADIDIHRSLFVHDSATLGAGNFSLRRTLTKLRDDVAASVPSATPESIFQQFMDTQNDTAHAATAGNALCSDNDGKINGYPLNKCPRAEGSEAAGSTTDLANRIDNDYHPVALVNRIDLADKGWKNCGEHRIVYGKVVGGFSKNFIIFEAVLPNPKPGCRSGCRDVIDFWVDLSADPSPASRAAKLETFFYGGIAGFEPVVKTTHYTSGVATAYGGSASGQIRTNQFLSAPGPGLGPWTLKEFKTFLTCAGGTCDYDILPISPKVNPYGVLWNRDVATGTVPALPPANGFATPIAGLAALASAFQGEVAAQVNIDRLGNPDLNKITYEVALDKNSAESQSQTPAPIDNYPGQFTGAADAAFRTNLDTLAAGLGLTGAQVVNRAMANSCAGCHKPDSFNLTASNAIGPGMSWPSALTFVHVDVNVPPVSLAAMPEFNAANFGGNANGHNISPALLNAFLPAREDNLVAQANDTVCDCVPKASVLGARDLAASTLVLRNAAPKMRAQLADAEKRFAAKSNVGRDDYRHYFAEKKAILANGQAARDKELAVAGLDLAPVRQPVQAINIAATRVAPKQLRELKQKKLEELVKAEPPRESVTGSFRPH